jgi:thiosulfate/3-mercaptopyruvate sulfurtransferase
MPLSFRIFNFVDKDGNVRPDEDLTSLISSAGLDPNKETITYCHGGVTSCIGYSALELAGFKNVRMYDGSWSEYSSKEETK